MSPLSIHHPLTKMISLLVCALLILQSSPLMAGPAPSDTATPLEQLAQQTTFPTLARPAPSATTAPSEQLAQQTTFPTLEIVGSPETGSVTVQVANSFKLVFDADHKWQVSELYDLRTDPTTNLAQSDDPSLTHNVLQSPLGVEYDQWYNLEHATDAALAIQSVDETSVVLETSWRWEANDGSRFEVSTTHTINVLNVWRVTTTLTNVSTTPGTRTFNQVAYAFTNGNPALDWLMIGSTNESPFSMIRQDTPSPLLSFDVQQNKWMNLVH